MPGDHLDQFIDDTARALTTGAPSPALRAHVRRRLESRPRSVRGWTWQIAAGAAALIMLSVVAGRTLLVGGGDLVPIEVRTEPVRELMLAIPATLPSPRLGVAAGPAPSTPVTDRTAAALLPVVTPIAVNPIGRLPLLDQSTVEVELVEVPMPLRAERVEIEPLVIE